MTSPNESSKPLPSREEEVELHRRLIRGDLTATADLAAALFGPLVQWLVSHNSRDLEDMCKDAASDAFCALMKNPWSYNAEHEKAKGLFAYLQMSAQGDLQNLLRQEGRHHQFRIPWKSVEESPDAWKYIGQDDDPAMPLLIKEEVEGVAAQVLPSVREGLTDNELRVLDLMLGREKKTAVYAEACGFGHLPFQQQRAEVKRIRDKLQQRLNRARSGHDQSS